MPRTRTGGDRSKRRLSNHVLESIRFDSEVEAIADRPGPQLPGFRCSGPLVFLRGNTMKSD